MIFFSGHYPNQENKNKKKKTCKHKVARGVEAESYRSHHLLPGFLFSFPNRGLLSWLNGKVPSPTEVFSVGSMVKNPPAGARDSRDLSSILWSGRKSQPTPVSLLGKPHGQRSLVGYHLRGCKESNMTEQPSTHAYLQQVMDRHLCVRPLPPRPPILKPRYWGVLTYTFNMGLTSYVLLW